MGKIDTITKDYMRNNSVFADAFNYFIYGGRQVIKPESLRELDTTEIAVPFGNGNETAVQKFRDLLKTATLMADDKAAYLVLGVENESEVKFAEPVKAGMISCNIQSKCSRRRSGTGRQRTGKGMSPGNSFPGFIRRTG